MKDKILKRFMRYAEIETTSKMHQEVIPSTECQWDLLKMLEQELRGLGLEDVTLNEHGYLIARLPSNIDGPQPPVIGFMAHVDTSSDVSGKGVSPQVHTGYDGKPLILQGGTILDPADFPELLECRGQTVITSDGTTLLGADDKAGIAEIMEALCWYLEHPEEKHGTVEIVFTPDEETGRGMDLFPRDELESTFCYTMDGSTEGELEAECFNAYEVRVEFSGRVIHLGSARGKLVNAVTMAAQYISLLPRNESPEATDGRYGYYCPLEIEGGLDKAEAVIFLRDFDLREIERRIAVLKEMGRTVEALYPGSRVTVTEKKQYLNMKEHMDKIPQGLDFLEKAVIQAGAEPHFTIIRGGTDGSRLSEMGIPTPNVFTGGHNYHSRQEWASLESMEKACRTVIQLIKLWAGA